MDKLFSLTFYNGCNYLSMLGLNLIHVSGKRVPVVHHLYTDTPSLSLCWLVVMDSFPIKNGYINGLVQDCDNASASAMEILHSCTKPSIFIAALLCQYRYDYNEFLFPSQGQQFSGPEFRIYLLGNPVTWWLNLFMYFVFVLLVVYHAFRKQRGYVEKYQTQGKECMCVC